MQRINGYSVVFFLSQIHLHFLTDNIAKKMASDILNLSKATYHVIC